jgi:hypothetical protein
MRFDVPCSGLGKWPRFDKNVSQDPSGSGRDGRRFQVRRQLTASEIEIVEIYCADLLDLGLARFYSLRERVRSAFAQ